MVSKGYAEPNNKSLKACNPNKPMLYIIYLDAAEANNKFIKSCNPNNLPYIIYLDTNNLYGYSIIKLLPFEILDWVNPEKLILDDYFDDGPLVCFLEVDLDHLDKLQYLFT